ncbi:MAG: hypothetical protein ACOXZS_04270 [Bacilli bacterium]|jgi:hypothetical protein
MDLKDMEASGVMDYYLDLSKFINIFINTNYPLTKEDVVALIEDRQTLNLKKRVETAVILNTAMRKILETEAEKNREFINNLENGRFVKPITSAEEKEKLFNYKQQMLGILWEYQHPTSNNKDMSEPNLADIKSGRTL